MSPLPRPCLSSPHALGCAPQGWPLLEGPAAFGDPRRRALRVCHDSPAFGFDMGVASLFSCRPHPCCSRVPWTLPPLTVRDRLWGVLSSGVIPVGPQASARFTPQPLSFTPMWLRYRDELVVLRLLAHGPVGAIYERGQVVFEDGTAVAQRIVGCLCNADPPLVVGRPRSSRDGAPLVGYVYELTAPGRRALEARQPRDG